MTPDDKLNVRAASLATTMKDAVALGASHQSVMMIVANTEQALRRAIKRAETLPAEYERVEFVQNRGPTVEFSGRQIAKTVYETGGRNPLSVILEVWETRGGAIVGMRSATPAERSDGIEVVQVAVAEPGDTDAMRAAIMDLFDWHDRARSMMRKQAGWTFRREVE